jgi:hypothetical protein
MGTLLKFYASASTMYRNRIKDTYGKAGTVKVFNNAAETSLCDRRERGGVYAISHL